MKYLYANIFRALMARRDLSYVLSRPAWQSVGHLAACDKRIHSHYTFAINDRHRARPKESTPASTEMMTIVDRLNSQSDPHALITRPTYCTGCK